MAARGHEADRVGRRAAGEHKRRRDRGQRERRPRLKGVRSHLPKAGAEGASARPHADWRVAGARPATPRRVARRRSSLERSARPRGGASAAHLIERAPIAVVHHVHESEVGVAQPHRRRAAAHLRPAGSRTHSASAAQPGERATAVAVRWRWGCGCEGGMRVWP
eukprot:3883752-Prymnesium_polylepis.1